MASENLTAGEFSRAIKTIHDRFDGVDQRIDGLGGEVAAVKARLDERTSTEKRSTRKASGWSAVIAGGIVAGFELVKALTK